MTVVRSKDVVDVLAPGAPRKAYATIRRSSIGDPCVELFKGALRAR